MGASPIFGSPHHRNTTSKVERVNGVIADVLRSFAGERADDWPALVPLEEFAINDSASPFGPGNMPFYADPLERRVYPRRPRPSPSQAAAPDPAGPGARRSSTPPGGKRSSLSSLGTRCCWARN